MNILNELPAIGAFLGGPAGTLAGAGIQWLADKLGASAPTVEAIKQTLSNVSPDNLLEAKKLDLDFQKFCIDNNIKLEIVYLQTAAQQVNAVNKTLQTEAMGGSFWQKNHHAFECSFICVLVGAIYFVLPLSGTPVPSVPESAWITLGAITGVTAWQRGRANIQTVSQGNT